MESLQNFYARLERVLFEKNMKPADLSRETGIDQGTISRWKKRGTTPQRDSIDKIVEVTNARREYLVFGTEPIFHLFPAEAGTSTINQTNVGQARNIQNSNINGGAFNTAEQDRELTRMYRDLEPLSKQILMEIADWLNDTEKIRPGFKAWFAVEFQNRFPELDDWKRNKKKNETGC